MPNFLEQLKRGGALDIASPTKAAQNALAMQGMKTEMAGVKLSNEGRRVLLGKEAMKNTQGLEGYPQTIDYMVNKLGIRKEDIPSYESFEGDEEKFSEFQRDMVSSGTEWLKAQKGQKHKVTIIYPSGRQVQTKMDSEQAEAYMKKYNVKIIPGTVSEKSIDLITRQAAAGRKEKAPSAFAEKREALTEEFPQATRAEKLEALYGIKPGEGGAKADRIWITKGNRKRQVREGSPEHIQAAEGGWKRGQPISTAQPPAAQSYILTDDTIVTSRDRGITYTDAEGKKHPMPPDAIKYDVDFTSEDRRATIAQKRAAKKLEEEGRVGPQLMPAEEAARRGTGPYAMMKSGINVVLGGALGFGTLFPENEESREMLRVLNQRMTEAFLLSPRAPVRETEHIRKFLASPDKFWRNPHTEAMKIRALRKVLLSERNFNLEEIAVASPKQIERLEKQNMAIERVLTLIGETEEPVGVAGPYEPTSEEEALLNKYPGK